MQKYLHKNLDVKYSIIQYKLQISNYINKENKKLSNIKRKKNIKKYQYYN